MAASAEVDALPAFRGARGVSRCKVDLFLLRALWQQHHSTAAPVRIAASFFSAHWPVPRIQQQVAVVFPLTCALRRFERCAPGKCACERRWQESCLSSAAQRSLREWRDTSEKCTAAATTKRECAFAMLLLH